MRFHVLGIGSIGTLVSHHLRLANPEAPISLVLRSARAFPSTSTKTDGHSQSKTIKLSVTRAGQTTTSDRFDHETYSKRDRYAALSREPDTPHGPISSLIVCLKTPNTLSALSQLKHRISPNSVIALLQNGMGVYDELCAKIWPEPATRPFFLLGTTTHGVTPSTSRGQVTHMSKAGEGDIKWGIVPDPRKEVDLEEWIYGRRVSDTPVLSAPPSPELPLPPKPSCSTKTDLSNLHATLSALLSLDNLNSTLLPMPHIHHTLLLKLALNANINPLTAILGAGSLPNGSLLGSSPSHRLIRMLSTETSAIITAYLANLYAPSAAPVDVIRLYSRDNLIARTLALCNATARNSSSMAMDASAGRITEIDYINGYLVSLGVRLGVPTSHHQMVREMVKFTSEVSGLKADTWPTDTKRVEWRQRRMSATAKRGQSASDIPVADAHPADAAAVAAAERKARFMLGREHARKRETRRQARRKERLARMESEGPPTDTSTGPLAAAPGQQAESHGASDSTAAEADRRATTLNFLERPGSTKSKADTAGPGSRNPTGNPLQLTAKVSNAEKPESEAQPDEEQDEAIKAIENRIFSGSAGSRRRF